MASAALNGTSRGPPTSARAASDNGSSSDNTVQNNFSNSQDAKEESSEQEQEQEIERANENGDPTAPPNDPPTDAQPSSGGAPEEGRTNLQTTAIIAALSSALFLAALDVTIVTVAIPTISQEFNSTTGYTWIGSAYLLANAATAPMWGKISDIWGRKPILLMTVGVFWVGSLICALSKNMGMLLAARAIQGIGGGGIIILVNICISDLFSMRKRGMFREQLLGERERSTYLVGVNGRLTYCACYYRNILWCHGHGLGSGERNRSHPRRHFHEQSHLEMVFLHQPTHLGRGHGHSGICPQTAQSSDAY